MENVKIVQLEERMAELENKVAEVKNTNDFGMLGFTILNAPTEIKVLKGELESLVSKYGDNLEQNVSQSTFHPAIMGNEVAEYTVFNGTAIEFIELHERKLSLLELILDTAKERKDLLESGQEDNSNIEEVEREQSEIIIDELESSGWRFEPENTIFMYDEPVAEMSRGDYLIQISRIPEEPRENTSRPVDCKDCCGQFSQTNQEIPQETIEMMNKIFSGGK